MTHVQLASEDYAAEDLKSTGLRQRHDQQVKAEGVTHTKSGGSSQEEAFIIRRLFAINQRTLILRQKRLQYFHPGGCRYIFAQSPRGPQSYLTVSHEPAFV
jgi:hypothetical protein